MVHADARRLLPLALGALLLGPACRPCGAFDGIAVEGTDDDAVRATVRAAVDAVDAWRGGGTVCVDRVVVTDALSSGGHDALGGYRSARREVLVDGTQPDLATTVVHEFCHALDWQDRVSQEAADLFPYDPERPDHDRRSPASRARESLALACEHGPTSLSLTAALARGCAIDEAAGPEHIRSEVFPAAGEAVPRVDGPTERGVWSPPEGTTIPEPFAVSLGRDRRHVRLLVDPDGGGDALAWTVDVTTGETVEADVPLDDDLAPSVVDLPAPFTAVVSSYEGPAGVRATVGSARLATGRTVAGVVHQLADGGLAVPRDPCVPLSGALLPTVSGALHLSRDSAVGLAWVRLPWPAPPADGGAPVPPEGDTGP